MFNFPKSILAKLAAIALALSFGVIILSSVMRLTNQGLGCSVWPECYGKIYAHGHGADSGQASVGTERSQAFFPNSFVARGHRAVATLLLLAIIAIAVIAWRRRGDPRQPVALPLVLLGLSLFLALLGAWYGSPLLRPPVMLANLLGGMALLALLWWLFLSTSGNPPRAGSLHLEGYRLWAILALAAVVAQTALGGWMSANFAALACTTIPDCNGSWWPAMNFSAGFSLTHTLAVGNDYKVIIDQAAVTAIHMVHRIGAAFVLLFVGALGYTITRLGGRFLFVGIAIIALLLTQVALGILVVVFSAPLAVVVAHNAVAALLWLAVIALIYSLKPGGDQAVRH